MTAYYNEHDPFTAAWLRNLIAANMIAPGDVDERSIEDVTPGELAKYIQCHFFAGIGVWSYGMRRAGWPDDKPAWTGSCPCQPFSQAGEGSGFTDKRHLWPAFFYLIRECEPHTILGEQVASQDGYAWSDLVQNDLEATDYAYGAVVTPAAGYGAPHARHRIYWMAYAKSSGSRVEFCDNGKKKQRRNEPANDSTICILADTDGRNTSTERQQRSGEHGQQSPYSGVNQKRTWSSPVNGFWSATDWLRCRDDKWRPVEPGTFPLAHGVANRVGLLRACGNAVVAPQAEEWARYALEYAP